MSNRLGGKQGTAYLGTNANQPPNLTFSDRNPTQYDINNVSLGDMWLNDVDKSVWILVSLAGDADSKGSLATWVALANQGEGPIDTLTGNTGGIIDGDINGNINIVGDGVGITITGNPGTHTLTASLIGGGAPAESFPTDSGTAVPVIGVLNIVADVAGLNAGSSVLFSAVGDTVKLNVTDSNDNTIIGRNSGSLTMTGGDNTILGEASGVSLTSGSDNTIIGGTSANALTSGSNNITLGSGAGSALTTTDSNNTLIGSPGVVGTNQLVVITAGAAGAPVFHNYPGVNASTTNGGNMFVGGGAGNFTLAGGAGQASNNALGDGALASLTTGAMNNAMGAFTLFEVTTGSNNVALGHGAGFNAGGSTGLVSGTFNTLIGYGAGDAYTGAESSNIILGGSPGVVGDSHTLRIGESTGTGDEQLNKSFIHGIRGITPTINDAIPVFINSVGQLGTVGSFGASIIETVTGNTGGPVSPAAGNINIVGDGTTIQITGNPGTNTLTVVGLGGGGGDLSILTGDTGSATAAGGTINVITDNAAQAAGSSVLFSGTSNTLTLQVSDANNNTLIGDTAGNATLTGTKNTSLGVLSATALTTGVNNAFLGYGSGTALTTGSYNTLLGYLAGSAYTTTEASNISINATGTIADSHTLRIGAGTGTGLAQLNKAFVSGIRGITPATADGIPVFIGSAGQLGTVGNGGSTMIQTVTGNTGGAVSPALGNINIVGDGTTIEITGNPGTNTLTVVGLGGGGGDLSILTGDVGSATAAAGTINVITNNTIQAAGSSVLFSGTSNTLTLQVTDNASNTIIGFASGKSSPGSSNTALGTGCATSLTSGSSNILVGVNVGSSITTGSGNMLFGNGDTLAVLRGTTTSTGLYGFGSNGLLFLHNYGGAASGNTFVGYGCAGNFNAGQQAGSRNNTGCGDSSLALLTTGANNTVVGTGAGSDITSGSSNTFLGALSGSNYLSSESSNICIGAGTLGTGTESNTLRIGSGTGTGTGQVNRAFMAGIRGITTGISNAIPVVIDSSGQLGTAGGGSVITTLTGNSGGSVSATAGNINIRGDGVSVNVVGNPGTSTLTISAVGGAGGPAFLAYMNASANYTGGSTVIYDTLTFNSGADFNLGTSIFTASVTGVYNFSLGLLGSSTTFNVTFPWYARIVTTSKTFTLIASSPVGASATFTKQNFAQVTGNFYTNMTAGDTAFITFTRIGGSPTAIVLDGVAGSFQTGATGIVNYFSGQLV